MSVSIERIDCRTTDSLYMYLQDVINLQSHSLKDIVLSNNRCYYKGFSQE